MRFFDSVQRFLSRFMYGRYGTDSLNRFLTILWLVAAIANLIFHSILLYIFESFLCVVVFFRMLSKNTVKRSRENRNWLGFTSRIAKMFRHIFVRFRDRKTTRFFHCPHCRAPIRMPRKIGSFRIRCNRCQKTFQKEFKR